MEDNIINLDDYRREKEEEESDALESERRYLGRTLKNVLTQIASVEDRTERLKNRDEIRDTRREIEQHESGSLGDSWFSRTFNFIKRDRDDD
jgi:hypothetical protein